MKNPVFSDSEVESLRAQVRQLRHAVAQLENRLADFEGEDDSRWGIWPYCYVVAAWNFVRRCFQSFHTKLSDWSFGRCNRRHVQSENPVAKLRLT